ncbi:hypothetical protein [Streptomyces sp. H27-D2]|uniref:hypothetical protein n=1 Tax=Streptomyces sp. H27-D2 TaxID=3046304 RepID=UPI002DB640B6|nr:hypothetical protein [Streptomyces sp. H27-D2]MEC4020601.1 hypothetical protein [Streptomyces sp. H27-D2]
MAQTRNGQKQHRHHKQQKRRGQQSHRKHSQQPSARRRLRREVPSTVAVLADAEDFAVMRRYASFSFRDHGASLRQVDGLLRSLGAQGVHTTVALFDPVDYEEFCSDAGIDPDTAAGRTRYTAETAATGAAVPYRGQPIGRLVPLLIEEAERQATWDYATEVLARSGACADCGEDLGHASFNLASQALRALIDAVGSGSHHLVCSVPAGDAPLLAVLHVECTAGLVRLIEAEALVFCTVLAAGIAADSPGGLVLRTSAGESPDVVRGWALLKGWLRSLSEGEVFTAYCTDADTGEPIPPEPNVEYRAGIDLPPPDDHHRKA